MNNEKINSKIKLSNNSSFVILIFVILKFWNIGRSTFRRYKFRPPPKKTILNCKLPKKILKILLILILITLTVNNRISIILSFLFFYFAV